MSSEDTSIIALSPFVRYLTYAVIKSIRAKNLSERKTILHADMVPKVSEKVMQASLGLKISNLNSGMSPSIVSELTPPKSIPEKTTLVQPIQKKSESVIVPPLVQKPKPIVRRQAIPKPQVAQQIIETSTPEEGLTKFYGKITPLLNDPSISIIKCSGLGIPITVVRRGQTQLTKITLNAEEINQILEKVSEAAHIPLLEGVFRVSVDKFSVDAVISEMIGSRFVIKKRSPMFGTPQSPQR